MVSIEVVHWADGTIFDHENKGKNNKVGQWQLWMLSISDTMPDLKK